MDHLYELDLFGIILMDEAKPYGFCIASLVGNIATLHVHVALKNVVGSYEELIQCFARTSMLKARYISFEDDGGNLDKRKKNLSYKPLKLEKYFGTFNL